MIPTLGHIALVIALAVALTQAGVHRAFLAVAFFALVSASFSALIYAHAVSDFSVLNVVENSHTLKPMIYKISGVWGNHEGSMLLWAWMLALWGFLVARAKNLPAQLRDRVLAVQGMIGAGFVLFILLTSNPFVRVAPAPAEGMDLNPLLQDIGLALHPPLLYAGYVGFSISFCFAMAALMERKVDAAWAALLRPWVLAAWVALTMGIASGAVWAYYELGWGGFWFWDPVENASLMPWLAGTALFHSVAVLEKRNTLGNWTVFLAILAFSLSLLGTFLVRSGVLTSVHAFATDAARGIYILLLLAVVTGGALLFFALRAPETKPGPRFSIVSREAVLLLNNVFLFTFCMTILIGTLYPVLLNALDLGSVSVGPPYYAATLLPLLAPFSLLMGAAPGVAWRQGDFTRLGAPFVAAVLMLAVMLTLPLPEKTLSMLGFGLGGWIGLATLYDFCRKARPGMPRSYYGMVLAHVGFGVMVIGITATTLWKEEKTLWMGPGDRVEIAGRALTFLGTHESRGSNYARLTGIFADKTGYLAPQKRWYPAQEKMTSEVSLKIDGFSLIYLVLGEQDGDHPEKWVVRAYYHPLVLWIFLGALMMAAGGIISLTDRRRHA